MSPSPWTLTARPVLSRVKIRFPPHPVCTMALSGFHPIVARWFSTTLGAPTLAQERGWSSIRGGRHTLIAAPTGSGKTLAAFLTAIDDLVHEGLTGPLP